MLHKAETRGLLHGARVYRAAPPISHLLFADDSLVFGKASPNEIGTIRDIIKKFTCASGQRVNFDKSEIAFSRCIPDEAATILGNQCGIPVVSKHSLYLGLPATVGRSKKEVFLSIEERVNKKLKNWKVRCLSQAAKLILIKSVAQTIPSYVMSCFLIPSGVLHRIDQIIANFWWGQKLNERKLHWCSWEITCSPLTVGGLGFRELECFNLAFLAKQSWRLLNQPESLLARSFKARYFPRTSLLDANVGYSPSYTWRSIVAGCKLFKQGAAWTVCDGRTINIWNDTWIPGFAFSNRPTPISSFVQELTCVRDLFNAEGTGWDNHLIFSTFSMEIARKITSIPINPHMKDCLRWKHTPNGVFTVRSGYWEAKPSSSSNNLKLWSWFWKLQVPPKFRVFMWRCFRGILPTFEKLGHRGIIVDPICHRCGLDKETIEHVFRDCYWSNLFWRMCPLRISDGDSSPTVLLQDWITATIKGKPPEFIEFFVALLWVIWKSRNQKVFHNKSISHVDCVRMAQTILFDYQHAAEKTIPRPSPLLGLSSWSPPAQGWIKFNGDVFLSSDGFTGLGGIFHDSAGTPLLAIIDRIDFCSNIDLAEGFACLGGIKAARENGFCPLVVELDNFNLVTYLQRKEIPRTPMGTLISEILSAASEIQNISFQWIKRDYNLVAHQIANYARNPNFRFTADVASHIVSTICNANSNVNLFPL